MGARGPKNGWRKVEAEQQQPPSASDGQQPEDAEDLMAQFRALPPHHREHPGKLSGGLLKILGHRKGIPHSALARMSDTQIRRELRAREVRRQHEEGAA